MAKSKSHSQQHSPHSKIVQRGAQQGLASQPKTANTPPPSTSPVAALQEVTPPRATSAFSAANASLQSAGTVPSAKAVSTNEGTPAPVVPATEPKTVQPPQAAKIVSPEKANDPAEAPTKPQVVAKASAEAKPSKQPTKPSQPGRGTKEVRSAPMPSRRVRPSVWIGGSLGALLLVVGGAAAGAYSKFASGGTIAPGVSIAGVPVGGLTSEAANRRVLAHFGQPQISLLCDGETVRMPISKLGARLSIEPTIRKAYQVGRDGFLPNNLLRVYGNGGNSKNFMLPIEWNKTQLVKGLQHVNSKLAIAPVDARLRGAEIGLEVVPDREGKELNVGAAAHLLQKKFYVGMPSLHVPSRTVEAKVKAEQLDGQDVQLASYTTHYNPGLVGRTTNLRIACRAIENHVLMPGETFSFNGCTGERTLSKGYRMGHIFLRQPGAAEAEVVDGLAGGVCQVSTTLYNAVRKANAKADINPIKIVERNTHSLPVTYVPRGFDATVAWPYKDFKFRNVTNYPVYVRTQMGGASLNIAVWGRIPNA